MTAQDFIQTYGALSQAKRVLDNSLPILEAIFKRAPGERMTARELGVELMGEKYNEVFTCHNWRGDIYTSRTLEGYSMSATIGAAFSKLQEAGLVERIVERDKTRPYFYEEDDYAYFDKDGNQVPDTVELTLANGEQITVNASALPGVVSKWSKVKKVGYPKVSYWALK